MPAATLRSLENDFDLRVKCVDKRKNSFKVRGALPEQAKSASGATSTIYRVEPLAEKKTIETSTNSPRMPLPQNHLASVRRIMAEK
jgi:hypothetical protein